MPCPSLMTSDEEIARHLAEGETQAAPAVPANPHRPFGLRRHQPGFVVPVPRRWGGIDFVTAPRIWTNGARNGRYRGFPAGPPGRHE